MRTFKALLLVGLFFFFSSSHHLCASELTKRLTIVFSGDTKGEIENCHCPKDDFGGFNRRYKYISDLRKEVEDFLLLDTGDVLPLMTPGMPEEAMKRDAIISFKAMSSMLYDAMCVGETDLLLGEQFLSEQQKENISFPLISANIVDKNTGAPFYQPYIIKTMKNGLRVGIVGLINERYILNSDNLTILPNKEVAREIIPKIKAESDIIVVLGHIGLPYAINLAESMDGIDIILSGHWDVETQEPIKVKDTIIMPTTYHSRKMGRLDLDITDGRIFSYTFESVPLDATYEGVNLVGDIISKLSLSDENVASVKKEDTTKSEIEEIASARPLRIMVFYSVGCRACMEVEKEILSDLEKKYGDSILIERYDIGLPQNYEQMARLERLYQVNGGGYVPEVVVARHVLMGKEEIAARLDEIIHDALEEPIDLKKNDTLEVAQYHTPPRSIILQRFESFGLCTVMTAGVLDGINPCAFTTIVFFISFLAFIGYRRREMFMAGFSFTFAVFITYLLIGAGLFRFLRAMKTFGYITIFINIVVIGLAFLLGILSLIDFIRFSKTNNTEVIILKLPRFIKNRIHSIIGMDFRDDRSSSQRKLIRIIWVAFTAGFLVSILESFCTGQVYLPTLAFVLRLPGKRISALLYLIFYNLAFIMPLIIVFFLGLFGVTSNIFSRFMARHLGLIKLATAVLFFLLGSALIIFK